MSCSKAAVRSNRQVSPDFYLLEAEWPSLDDAPGSDGIPAIRAGQFCMLRSWDSIPVLSRPISVFDADGNRVSFLYKTVGRGTAIFSRLKPGDSITIQGPLGNGFPMELCSTASGRVAMVGGGAGIAPLYLGAKQYKAAGCTVDLYLGFSGAAYNEVSRATCNEVSRAAFLTEEYRDRADSITVNVGGFITDAVDPVGYDAIFTCGPEVMMKALWEKCKAAGAGDKLFVSLEARMACGVGACYGCSRKTASAFRENGAFKENGAFRENGGNKKVCKDGPVFPAQEVFGL
ncbi:dihydroorotate dehydrogenase [Spirochaetia bacterium]|nr:dihydroorotate dehydrogenase [Spirochaetia bacterium]